MLLRYIFILHIFQVGKWRNSRC